MDKGLVGAAEGDTGKCDRQYYEIDIPACRAMTYGSAAARNCYASASERYAACLAGRPSTPLDTGEVK